MKTSIKLQADFARKETYQFPTGETFTFLEAQDLFEQECSDLRRAIERLLLVYHLEGERLDEEIKEIKL